MRSIGPIQGDGLTYMLRQFSGATIRRVIDRSDTQVAEHAHDWPVLSLFVMGRYLNETEVGAAHLDGPSAIFYRAGAFHRNTAGAVGFEQIEIEFDPDWFGPAQLPEQPVSHWIGGSLGGAARQLARFCAENPDEQEFRSALRHYMQGGVGRAEREIPSWIHAVKSRIESDKRLRIGALAREVGRHPSWLGSAYRRYLGESPMETAARFRVEVASRYLRETTQPLAVVAHAADFCDQSHMNRTFRRLLGRTPAEVRRERTEFRDAGACIEKTP